MKIISSTQLKELDKYTIAKEPVASIDLMERAAEELTRAITHRWDTSFHIVVFAGPGNNGGDALAVARMLSKQNYHVEVFLFNTKGKMLQDIMVSLGGRIAEELVFEDVTTGASQDIKQATATARAMVTQYGMSSLGMINYGSDDDEVFIGRDLAHTRAYSEKVAAEIDAEVKRIIDECYDKAKAIIVKHEQVLHSCSDLLMKKEKIGQQEFEELFAATM